MWHETLVYDRFCDILLLVRDDVTYHFDFTVVFWGLSGRIFSEWIHDGSMQSPCFSHMLTRNLSCSSLLPRIKSYLHNLISGISYLPPFRIRPDLAYHWCSGISPVPHKLLIYGFEKKIAQFFINFWNSELAKKNSFLSEKRIFLVGKKRGRFSEERYYIYKINCF